MKNINNYKKRFYGLLESEVGNVKPLINETSHNQEEIDEFFFKRKKKSPEEYTKWVEDQEGEYYEECPECSRYGLNDDCPICDGEGKIPLQDTDFPNEDEF